MIFCQEENDLFKIMIAILELYWENEELTAVRHDWVHEHLRNLKVHISMLTYIHEC